MHLQADGQAASSTPHTHQKAPEETDRFASAQGASSSKSTLAMILQDGFAEGMVSVKEALVYVSKPANRYAGMAEIVTLQNSGICCCMCVFVLILTCDVDQQPR